MIWFTLFTLITLILIFILDVRRLRITPNPTTQRVRQKILEGFPKIEEGVIYELGSGFGHMTLFLSKHFPNCRIKSYEHAHIPFLIQKIWLMLKFQGQVELKFEDFLKNDISDAKLIFCYLYPAVMSKIAEKFYQETSPGTWLITHTFAMRTAKPKKIIIADDLYHTPIYFYQR